MHIIQTISLKKVLVVECFSSCWRCLQNFLDDFASYWRERFLFFFYLSFVEIQKELDPEKKNRETVDKIRMLLHVFICWTLDKIGDFQDWDVPTIKENWAQIWDQLPKYIRGRRPRMNGSFSEVGRKLRPVFIILGRGKETGNKFRILSTRNFGSGRILATTFCIISNSNLRKWPDICDHYFHDSREFEFISFELFEDKDSKKWVVSREYTESSSLCFEKKTYSNLLEVTSLFRRRWTQIASDTIIQSLQDQNSKVSLPIHSIERHFSSSIYNYPSFCRYGVRKQKLGLQ